MSEYSLDKSLLTSLKICTFYLFFPMISKEMERVMYRYDGLLYLLKQNNIRKSDLTKLLNISSRTIAKISRGEKLSTLIINKLCLFFGCSKDDLYTVISDNPILQRLRDEKNHKISGGLYHEIQVRMTYNSNHIEGNSLSEEKTRLIFETHTIGSEDSISVDDIIETVNHFRAIDYCIDIAEKPLTEDIIKHIHYLVKRGIRDETFSWFNVGEYKTHSNLVGGIQTSDPESVENDIQQLLLSYTEKKNISFEDIVEFHYLFECIHPFQDGNGRVGRLIAFKECLKYRVVPIIIEDEKKFGYYRGLKEFLKDPGYLIDTCYDGQDTIKQLLKYFNIESC